MKAKYIQPQMVVQKIVVSRSVMLSTSGTAAVQSAGMDAKVRTDEIYDIDVQNDHTGWSDGLW